METKAGGEKETRGGGGYSGYKSPGTKQICHWLLSKCTFLKRSHKYKSLDFKSLLPMTATKVENCKEAREKEKKRREDAIRLAEDKILMLLASKSKKENQFPYDSERCQLNFLVDFFE